jgi:hypothetical protein
MAWRGELGHSGIFCSADDATDSAFKAAQFRQAGYSGNSSGKPHRFPAAWAVWDVGVGARGIHACLVAHNRVWSFDLDQARHPQGLPLEFTGKDEAANLRRPI